MRKTKIVATLGPASNNPEVFRRLVESGLDVARINLSHGMVDRHRDVIRMVRAVERDLGRPIGILLDTAGPEIRLRTISDDGLWLRNGMTLTIGDRADADLKPSVLGLARLLKSGHQLILGDGNLALEVIDSGQQALVKVLQGGHLDNNKKVTAPGQAWALPVLTDDDVQSLKMGIEEGIDWIAASFIRKPEDVVDVRRQLESWGGAAIPIMAKIETRLAVENLEMIVRLADGIMVARGDLGVEFPPEDVPWLQKTIIDAANRAGKPVVTATQMLESMVHCDRPTRAEVTDVAHAVLEGSDAVMLSEETAMGDFPVQAVEVMARAAQSSEAHPWDGVARVHYGSRTVTDAVCHAALTAADDLNARLIITATESGHTAQAMAAHRPQVPILAVTPYQEVGRRLTIVWGLNTQIMKTRATLDGMVDESLIIAAKTGLADAGDRVVVTAGAPVGEPGSTNVLRVARLGRVLLRGQGLGPEGEVKGPVLVVEDPLTVDPQQVLGKILVAAQSDGDWTDLMAKSRAIVVEAGGLTSHAAVVGVSLGIPTVVGVQEAASLLTTGQVVTVDAGAGLILQADDVG